MTAAALAAARGEAPEISLAPDLLEQDFGAWQGLTHAAIAAREPEAAARFWRDPAHGAPPGGESFAAMCRRVAKAIDEIAARHGAEDLVLVAHAGTVRAALAHALGLAAESALRFAIDPLSLTRLDCFTEDSGASAGAWRVGFVNLPPREPALSPEW
jgi:alpha-ribazole phosphatase